MHGLQSLIDEADDQLGLVAGLVRGAGGQAVCFIAPQWTGDAAAGQKVVARLQALGLPIKSTVRVQPWRESLRAYDAFIVDGRHHFQNGRSLPRLTPAAIQAVADAASTLPQHGFIALHELHGAATRVSPDATAYANRSPHVLVQIMTGWTAEHDSSERQKSVQWVTDLSDKLSSEAVATGWTCMLGTSDQDRERARLCFGNNLQRLRSIKQRVDPNNLFRFAMLTFDDKAK